MVILGPGDQDEVRHTALAVASPTHLLGFDLVTRKLAPADLDCSQAIAVTRVSRNPTPNLPADASPWETRTDYIACLFNEPFQGYLIGDDYYFLTRSGSVCRAPPGSDNQRRVMGHLQPTIRRPFEFVITDASVPGKHFLFGRDAGTWFYAELGPSLTCQHLPPGTVPERPAAPTDTAVELVKFLAARKLVTLPPADADRPAQ